MKETITDQPSQIKIHPAQPRDKDIAADLIYQAGKLFFDYVFHPGKEQNLQFIGDLFQKKANFFSYQHTHLASLENQKCGLITYFSQKGLQKYYWLTAIKSLSRLNIPVIIKRGKRIFSFLQLLQPIDSKTNYIIFLAVKPDYRHRGIGTHLLQFCEKKSREERKNKMALDVVMDNQPAISCYQKFGFQIESEMKSEYLKKKFGFRGYYRMIKKILNAMG